MASEQTQEMELPLHAAASEGHAALVRLLLEFDYKTAVEESVSIRLCSKVSSDPRATTKCT